MLFPWLLLFGFHGHARALNNGLARTPPMGWLSWERFECNTDCDADPDNCIGERLLMEMADRMAAEGYHDVGYEYITVDDCWPAEQRDNQGRLQPDPRRFPSGMKALADYIHSKGLKLGLYEDVGRHTCAGFPGSQDHYQLDAQTFAEWGVDMLKFDGCNTDVQHYEVGFPAMRDYLNATGRHVMYSCEWPIYSRAKGVKPNMTAVAETCNTFRAYGDIWDNFQSIYSIVQYYGDNEDNFSSVAGPGNFNDADMLVLGNYGMSHDEERVQFGMWAMLASPLLMSVDLRSINARSKALLQNIRVIAINQDPLGAQGKRVINSHDGMLQFWTKPLRSAGSVAIAVVYLRQAGYPIKATASVTDLGLQHTAGYRLTEVFDGHDIGVLKPGDNYTCRVNPPGIVLVVAHRIKQSNRKGFRNRKGTKDKTNSFKAWTDINHNARKTLKVNTKSIRTFKDWTVIEDNTRTFKDWLGIGDNGRKTLKFEDAKPNIKWNTL